MYIKLAHNQPLEPGNPELWPHVTESTVQNYFPKFDLRTAESFEAILQSVIDLSAYYFQLPADIVKADTNFFDLERHSFALLDGCSFEDVKYNRIGCSIDEKGNAIGGIEDRGLMLYAMFNCDAEELYGISLVTTKAEASVRVKRGVLPNFSDCDTPYDLAKLFLRIQTLYQQQLTAA
ncbi:hypothetical protein [Paraferrimonas sp. SM1919]|uniref:hypothetical protein n=1 Tax=Paraferrimonas sp. SM1919 TaxID=2662263 RepID=UPI0013D61995|nr:hypothetical protein [Paraferrimonas sp. SM1919]